MAEATITLDANALEIARRGAMDALVFDLRTAARHLEELRDAAWPGAWITVSDPREDLLLLSKTIAALEQLGWPTAEPA